MAIKLSAEKIQFNFGTSPRMDAKPREPETPFVLAVLGDFSGRSSRGVREMVGGRKVWRVECDNFEQVLARLRPQLQLSLPAAPGGTLNLSFGTLEDFHPDRLLKQVPRLAGMLEQRKRLLNPATSASAATEMQALLANPLPQPAAPTATPASGAESDADTMSRLLGGATEVPAQAPKTSGTGGILDKILKQAVQSSAIPSATPQQGALLSVLDLELAGQLHSLLHDPQFQALEAAWRGMDLLVRNFGGEENLKLCLVDVTKEELAADLRSQDSLAASGLWKILEHQAQETAWAAWFGLYTFGDQPEDFETLGRLAKIAAQARAPFIAAASPSLVGCASFGLQTDPDTWNQAMPAEARQAWSALRGLPEARSVGLALPRFLLRLPYGQRTEAIDSFPFEELSGNSLHEQYLWGNPAVLCGHLLASTFLADGWDMQSGFSGEISDLPIHGFTEDGESKVKPCAEAWLGERACQAILRQGLIPILSIKGRDAVQVITLQSIAGSDLAIG